MEKDICKLIKKESARQLEGLELIPSENYASENVLRALGSILTNKYSEGYPKKRYYGGNKYVDEIEIITQNLAKKLFSVPHANVQPYSGSPANFAVYLACCQPGDSIMGLNLPDGGHLTHGWKASATAQFYKSISYHVLPSGEIDYDELYKLARQHRPKIIWSGATAYPLKYNFAKFYQIANEVGAYHVADIAHIAGLVVAGLHPSPKDFAHIITTTIHKTLRGPRGGMIMVTDLGLAKDNKLSEKIDKAVFPGLQGGPHDNQIAAIALALEEASKPEFKEYVAQIIENAKVLADQLKDFGLKLVADKTENHLILIDLTPILGPGSGILAQEALEFVGITANKNTIPRDQFNPMYPSGLRIGTPAITTRGMKQDDMIQIANWISLVINEIKSFQMPEQSESRSKTLQVLATFLQKNRLLSNVKEEIKNHCLKFPIPGINKEVL